MSNVWAIDIETVALPTASLQSLRGKEADGIAAIIEADKSLPPGERKLIRQNLTDQKKIDRDAEQKIANARQLIRETDSLDPLTAMPICVVAIPLAPVAQAYQSLVKPGGVEREGLIWGADALDGFYTWTDTNLPQFVGFNIRDFDLPVLRNWQARLSSGPVEYLPPLWQAWRDVLVQFTSWAGARHSTAHRLRDYVASLLDEEARLGGVVAEYLSSDFDGSSVADAYASGNLEAIAKHCKLDCLMSALLAVKMGVVRE